MRRAWVMAMVVAASGGVADAGEKCIRRDPPRLEMRIEADGGDPELATAAWQIVAQRRYDLEQCLGYGRVSMTLTFRRGRAPKLAWPDAGSARKCFKAIEFNDFPKGKKRKTVIRFVLSKEGDGPDFDFE